MKNNKFSILWLLAAAVLPAPTFASPETTFAKTLANGLLGVQLL